MSDVMRAVLRLALRAVALVVIVAIFRFQGSTIWRLFSPFLLATPVALLLQKPIHWTEKKLRFKHGLSVAVWVVLVCAIICLLLYFLLSTVVSQIIYLSSSYQSGISDIVNLLRDVANQFFDSLDYLPAAAEEWARASFNELLASLSLNATRWLGSLLNWAIGFASSIPYGLIYLNFLLLGIFFLSSNFAKIRRRVKDNMGKSMRDHSHILSLTAVRGLSGYIRVQVIYAILVFFVSLPALSLFGMPYAFLITLLAAVLEFLPIFGNGTLYIPIAVINFIIGNPTLAIEMLSLHMALYIFRRFTEPRLMSNSMGLSPLLSLVAMFVGMQLGGVLGLILAPMLVVVAQGAWQGGLFLPTMTDLRHVIMFVSNALAADSSGSASDAVPADAEQASPQPPKKTSAPNQTEPESTATDL